MDLGLGLFYYTLIVLLAVILTAATCLASYLVTNHVAATATMVSANRMVKAVGKLSFLFFLGGPSLGEAVLVGSTASVDMRLSPFVYLRRFVRQVPDVVFIVSRERARGQS